jgi:hypothetical protein
VVVTVVIVVVAVAVVVVLVVVVAVVAVVVVIIKPVESLNECLTIYISNCNFYSGTLLNHCFTEYARQEFKRFLKD